MKPSAIFGIDKRAIFMMVVLCLGAAIALAFRSRNEQPCQPFTLRTQPADFHAGAPVVFTAENGTNTYVWDFGDSIHSVKGDAIVSHVYTQPGQYTIYAATKGGCVATVTIDIVAQLNFSVAATKVFAVAPQPVIEKKPTVLHRKQTAPKPDKLLHLKEKPEDSTARVRVSLPVIVPLTKMTAPPISPSALASLLEQVVTGNKTDTDFDNYFCGNINVNVIYNTAMIPFTEMCKRLRTIKKLNKIDPPLVLITRDESTGCIKSLDVSVKKRNFFEKLLRRK